MPTGQLSLQGGGSAGCPSSTPAHGPSETHTTPQNSSQPHLGLLQPLPGVSALGRTSGRPGQGTWAVSSGVCPLGGLCWVVPDRPGPGNPLPHTPRASLPVPPLGRGGVPLCWVTSASPGPTVLSSTPAMALRPAAGGRPRPQHSGPWGLAPGGGQETGAPPCQDSQDQPRANPAACPPQGSPEGAERVGRARWPGGQRPGVGPPAVSPGPAGLWATLPTVGSSGLTHWITGLSTQSLSRDGSQHKGSGLSARGWERRACGPGKRPRRAAQRHAGDRAGPPGSRHTCTRCSRQTPRPSYQDTREGERPRARHNRETGCRLGEQGKLSKSPQDRSEAPGAGETGG